MITAEDAATFERCMAVGGFAVFPADTVYGLACDPDAKETVQRMHLLKRRSMDKPSAVMFFDAELALETLTELEGPVRDAAQRLLPGAVTLLIPNPSHRFSLACGADPGTLGLRVPKLDTELRNVRWPVLQTSANFARRPDPRRLQDVPVGLRDSAELVLDGGELPGTPSTVIDLRDYAKTGEYAIVRQGLFPADEVASRLQ
ncbi:MAG: Sua5/YciO/YrdC/YwlC family protein [Actinobacteria bacterium]|nr:MAG: Sua5/YciO/YrdC/YwlC family protein [Actinomycetota bacterium]